MTNKFLRRSSIISIISLVLVISLLIGAVACGGNRDEGVPDTSDYRQLENFEVTEVTELAVTTTFTKVIYRYPIVVQVARKGDATHLMKVSLEIEAAQLFTPAGDSVANTKEAEGVLGRDLTPEKLRELKEKNFEVADNLVVLMVYLVPEVEEIVGKNFRVTFLMNGESLSPSGYHEIYFTDSSRAARIFLPVSLEKGGFTFRKDADNIIEVTVEPIP